MGFLMFLQRNCGEVILSIIAILIFLSGWHLRGLQDIVANVKVEKQETKVINNAAIAYEKTFAAINVGTENLNQELKVIYAQPSNRCLIPAYGLHLLTQANR